MLVRIKQLIAAITLMAFAASTGSAKDIVDTAVGAGSFTTLVAAVQAAGLVDTLKGDGPFTVFAPTDEAFAKLPAGTVETLLKPENKQQLADILTYHVVSGKVLAKDVVGLTEATSVQGGKIGIAVVDGAVKLNGDSTVVKTDIECDNGVIHVIDAVILPPKKEARVSPQHIIQQAVAQGAPMYNAGHIDGCCTTYTNAISTLMNEYGREMPVSIRSHLQTSLNNANSLQCSDSRAWALRRALDQAYTAM